MKSILAENGTAELDEGQIVDDLESYFNELAFYVLDDSEILQSVKQDVGMVIFKLLRHWVENGFEECKSGNRVIRKTSVRKKVEMVGNGQTNEYLISIRNFNFILPEMDAFKLRINIIKLKF